MRCWIVEPSEPLWLSRLWQAMSSVCAWAAAANCALTFNVVSPALARAPLILVDDLGLVSVPGKLYREFLEMLDDRQGQGATLITSQFPVSQWHEVIADPTVADAILDRLVHNAYRIELKGESLRKGKTPSENET